LTKKRQKLLGQLSEDEEEETREQSEKDNKKVKDIIDVSSLDIAGVKTVSRKLFEEIIEARLGEMFDLIIKHVEQSGNEARLPAGIVITGGTALIPGITNIAKKVFGIPARIGYPKGLAGLVDEISNPAYAVAQGLILYGAANEGMKGLKKQISSKGQEGGVFGKVKGFFKNLLP
jgi:cell division protein FtsA